MSKQTGGLKVRSLGQITGFLILMSAASRILGYVRQIVITTNFGQTATTDAYNAAFMLPDVLYLVLVGGAFSTAFIPVLSEYILKDREQAWVVTSTILNLVLIFVTLGIGALFVAAPAIVENFLGYGYAPETQALTIFLTRIMLIQSFFMCLSGICQGICHVFQQFTLPAIGSLLYNIAIILIGHLLTPYIGIVGFALGVVIGSFLNFAVQLPTLRQAGVRYRAVIQLRHPGVREFFKLALPVVLGLSVIYLNTFVTQFLGSQLAEGSVSALQNANRLMQLPIGIFAIAIATSFFPSMTAFVAQGEMDRMKDRLVAGINLNFFIMIPASVGLMVVAEPLIRLLFLQGRFTEHNAILTASILAFYCIGIIGYSQQQILNRGFYAIKDTNTAVAVNVVIILANVLLSFLLVDVLGANGLALAYSLAGLLSMVLLYGLLRRKIGTLGGDAIRSSFVKILLASLIMGVTVHFSILGMEQVVDVHSKLGQMIELLVAVGVGCLTYIAAAMALRLEEMKEAMHLVRRKLRRTT